MSGRGKRVLIYAVSLLGAPLPVMPWVPGTREFAYSLLVWGAVMTVSSFYVARGEMKQNNDLLGIKLLVSSLITLVFAAAVLVGTVVYLIRT